MEGLDAQPHGRAAAPRGVCFASPIALFGLGPAHSRALSVVRDVFGLDQGPLGARIDRMLGSGADEADHLFLLHALLLSDADAAHWREHWPRLWDVYQIELGTQVLLGPLERDPVAVDLLAHVRRAGVAVAMDAPWSPSLQATVAATVLPGLVCQNPDGCHVWVGRHGDLPDRAQGDRVSISFGDTPTAATLGLLRTALPIGSPANETLNPQPTVVVDFPFGGT